MPAGASPAARELAELVRIPSVSSDPRHAGDVRRAAAWVAARLRRAGMAEVDVVRGLRHPIVVGSHRAGPRAPTVLLYGHYDVQPPGPASQWRTPPFKPVVRGADLHGRGASDDKGQLLCEILAAERAIRAGTPVNVVIVADGEEEVGSPSMPALLDERLPAWRPAAAIVCDTRMLGPGRPALTTALRGSVAFELTVEGPRAELHSGQFGGAVRNPLEVVCALVAGLHDRGRVAVPGLYDDVRPVRLAGPPPRSDAEILAEAGVRAGHGEPGFSAYERTTMRPSLSVTGIAGGHSGPGVPSIIPPSATAKLSLRLVERQRPDRVERLLRERIAALAPRDVRWRLERRSASLPVVLDPRDAAHAAAARAVERVWGRPPALLRSGGSIPLVNLLAQRHRVPTVLLGFALPDDGAHGPNERFHLPHLALGARTLALALRYLSPRAATSTIDASMSHSTGARSSV